MNVRERILQYDQLLTSRLLIAEQPGLLRTLFAILGYTGDSWFWIAALLILWWQGNPYWKTFAAQFGTGILVTAVFVMLIKITVRRARPAGVWGARYRRTDPHSFPSGHAARAVSLAVMAVGFAPAWLAVLLIVWAPLVALARVMMGLHFLSDIAAGGMLGLFTGTLMLLLL